MAKESMFRSSITAVLWRTLAVTFVLVLLWRVGTNFATSPFLENVVAEASKTGSKYGCKHFYFNVGVRDGTSIVEFITGVRNSSDRMTRAMVGYSLKNDLFVEEFCVFGFEPNLVHSDALHRVLKEHKTSVRYLHIFTGTLASTADTVTTTSFNATSGGLLSWGRRHFWADSNDTLFAQSMALDFGKFLSDALGEEGARGRVLMRVDFEGAEVVLIRDNLPLICKYVNKLEVDFHTSKFGSRGTCAQWVLTYMLGGRKCKPRWPRPDEVPEICDLWNIGDHFEL